MEDMKLSHSKIGAIPSSRGERELTGQPWAEYISLLSIAPTVFACILSTHPHPLPEGEGAMMQMLLQRLI